ncbi:hypothetical protein HHK36_004754 [Tetracentron sinense]|uniref:non-specific serine/threonine protein kinase n=1 Tax=Tetracentron sinense TaxID=13715 RepID=A0A835DM60_TETSI|nr:hypothetical protein HHK36_004754 [Tetracentron sinense]
MRLKATLPNPLVFSIFFCCFCFSSLIERSEAQATTDAAEARALNSIFQQWDLIADPSLWNISGEPCSGAAINDTDFEDPIFNPAIKCDCDYDNGTTCHITHLKLDQNYFVGPLPAFLGNISKLQYLAFGSNDFSGPLPPELGNLIKLEQLYIDSSGVSGEIPSTFAKLQNMQILRLQGNSFEGPIPSSFSRLTSMTDLRISELSKVGSSLDFIKDMKNLRNLVLRNSMISGSIPSDTGEYQKLQTLDLSFNKLTGLIPSSLFNLSSLSRLFLGNNSLSGTLPSQKSQTLLTIDLSYNELSGSFPSWVTPNSQCVLPGLNCLQKNFPCNRDSPKYANFSIKCGGQEMRSSEGVVFEAENSTLGPASYYVVDTNKWAVSNVGDSVNADYVETTLAKIDNNLNPEFFQTARLSPGSLRYYGLGLADGSYTVSLYFAETRFDDIRSRTWESFGRRVFDIYIQRNLERENFDIRNEAGGGSKIAIQRDFKAEVTENYLEIHLFWAGKGTCCIPNQGYYGPSISGISVISDFQPPVSDLPPPTASRKKNKTGLIVGILVSVGVVSFISIFAVFYFRREKLGINEDEELLAVGLRPNMFSYAELRNATEDFNPENKLGEGGFGPVYKGILLDGRVVAVKKLSVASHQGKSQFIAEIATISAVQHRNLVKLYGCCIEGDKKLLVYEYLENRSLDQALFGKIYLLEWAWSLHEDNRSFELVDPTLTIFDESEAIRVIGVALLCTQASPMMRPPMSRVVAMLAGDVEVSTVTSRPGYLTDWQFNDITSSSVKDCIPTSLASRNTNSRVGRLTSPSMAVDPIPSPVNITQPMLHEIIGDGR